MIIAILLTIAGVKYQTSPSMKERESGLILIYTGTALIIFFVVAFSFAIVLLVGLNMVCMVFSFTLYSAYSGKKKNLRSSVSRIRHIFFLFEKIAYFTVVIDVKLRRESNIKTLCSTFSAEFLGHCVLSGETQRRTLPPHQIENN